MTNADAAPTALDFLGFDCPETWHGRSVRPVVKDPSTAWRDHIVVDHGLYTAQRAVRMDRWKYIRTFHPGMWPSVTPKHQLFDMTNDPWEQDNLADDHPQVVADLEEKMLRWADRYRGQHEDSLRRTAREGPMGIEFAPEYDGV